MRKEPGFYKIPAFLQKIGEALPAGGKETAICNIVLKGKMRYTICHSKSEGESL